MEYDMRHKRPGSHLVAVECPICGNLHTPSKGSYNEPICRNCGWQDDFFGEPVKEDYESFMNQCLFSIAKRNWEYFGEHGSSVNGETRHSSKIGREYVLKLANSNKTARTTRMTLVSRSMKC
jgi:ribosomal protein S27E